MDVLLLVAGLLLMLIGIVGSILPVLPGVPVSWLGLLCLYLAPSIPFDWLFIVLTGVIALALYILDYVIPAMGTKRFGGSKAGAWGTTLGLLVGIFVPIPFGILIGPFLGALIGEMVFNQTKGGPAMKAAFGSFIGLLASTFMKLMATLVYFGLFLYKTFTHWDMLFH